MQLNEKNEETALDLAKKLNYHECEEILSKTSETKKRKISHDSDDDDKDSKSSNSPIELPSRSDFKKFQISSMDVEWIVEQVKNKKDWIHKYLLLCEKWKQECLSDTMRISEASVEVAFKILEDLRNDFLGLVTCCGHCTKKKSHKKSDDECDYGNDCSCPCSHCCTNKDSVEKDVCLVKDHLIPLELREELRQEISKLENVDESKKDYHPGSNNQVLDLIHPSLYCYHYAHSVLKEDSPFILESNPDILWIPTWFKKQRTQNTTHFVQQNSQHESDSIKDQAEKQNQHSAEIDFDITYESYINNICEVKQKNLANVICKVMCYFVPMWEQHYSIHYSPCDVTFDRFQVIVKAATIVVHPDKPYYPGGTWHTEGLDENIVATGIYYYHSENVKESFLDFRQNLTDRELRDYGAPEGTLSFELLGSVETKQDRCIAFPNIFQHRVKHFFPLDPTRPAIRKILVFFLINPKKPIISTNDIDVQRLDFLLNRCMVLCKILPLEIIYRHILDFLPHMTLEEARDCRLELMEGRKYMIEEENTECERIYEIIERPYSLCEH